MAEMTAFFNPFSEAAQPFQLPQLAEDPSRSERLQPFWFGIGASGRSPAAARVPIGPAPQWQGQSVWTCPQLRGQYDRKDVARESERATERRIDKESF